MWPKWDLFFNVVLLEVYRLLPLVLQCSGPINQKIINGRYDVIIWTFQPIIFSAHLRFGFFVKWHIKLCRLFNAKAILREEKWCYYLTHSWKDKGVHTFPKGIYPKVNLIARLECELAYYDSAVHHFNYYTTRTPIFVWVEPILLRISRYLCSTKFCWLYSLKISFFIDKSFWPWVLWISWD